MPVTLNFRKSGQGPVLIILHGLFGSSDNWITIAKKLEGIITVIFPDLRNHGQSPHTSSHTYKDMTDDLVLLCEALNIGKASILGHSMGGKVAMMFAADYPEKINNLIVADIAPKSYTQEINPIKNSEENELIPQLMDKLDLKTYTTRREINQFLALNLDKSEFRQFIMKNISRNSNDRFEWKFNLPVLRDSMEIILRDVNKEWFIDRKPILDYPVTFIRGLKSEYILDNDIPSIKNIYPEAKIVDIPNAGHWIHFEQPDLFLKALTEAIQR